MNWLHSLRSRFGGSPSLRRASKSPPRRQKPSRRPALENLETRLAPSVNLVSDINSYTKDSSPQNLTDVNGTLFFTAVDNTGNRELFKSTGTAASTTQLTFGTRLNGFEDLISFNGKLFFNAYDSFLGYHPLYVSDGTVAGTTPFLAGGDAIYLNYYNNPSSQGVVGSKFYFEAYDGGNNFYDLWETDGTSAHTHPVQPGSLTTASYYIFNLTNVNGKLFFEGYDSVSGDYTLWTSDGTSANTSMVKELTPNQAEFFTAVGSELYFEMYDSGASKYALWKSDGTSANTQMVADIGTTSNQFYSLTAFNNKVWFQVDDSTDAPNTSWALWSSDGTGANTGVFKYNASTTAVQVNGNTQIIVFSSALYLAGWDPTDSYSLWKTDGVAANNKTAPVQNSGSNPFNYDPRQLTINGSTLYFVAYNSSDGGNYDLWKTDGTSANTKPVQQTSGLGVNGFARAINNLTASGSLVYFQAYDVDVHNQSPHGYELWSSDGTNANTAMVTDINTTTYDSNPTNLIAIGSEVFFNAFTYAPPEGTYLWQSDGTGANTLPVQTSTGTIPTSEENAIAVGNTLFFTAYGTNGYDLWTTGTGTKSAVEVLAGGSSNPFSSSFDSSNADAFANLGGTLYFGAYDAANAKYALWKSDGTAAHTKVLADLDPSYQLSHLTVVGTNLFWQQYDSAHSTYALWEYNGTTASLVQDISANGISSLTAVGSSVFFQAYDSGTNKYALWTSNGTTTTNLVEINNNQLQGLIAFNSKLYFGAYYPTNGNWVLWSSDGTVANTAMFLTASSQTVYLNSSPNFAVVGGTLYGDFVEVGGRHVLGKTDGTAGGTAIVQAGGSGTLALDPFSLANDNGTLVFNAHDSSNNYQLWQSDGTANGTLQATNVPGPEPGIYPTNITVAGSQVFFNAIDYTHGAELWVATLASDVVTAGIAGPTDGVTMQHRDFVLTGNDSNSGNNAAGFSFAINWGDSTTETLTGLSGLTADHQYATAGSFLISVTATNLADNVAGAPVTLTDNITATEVQGGNLALGGLAGNDAFVITKGTGTSYTVKVNSTTLVSNFAPATGEQIFLYGGNGTNTYTINDSGTTADAFTLGTGYVTFIKATFVPQNNPGPWTINGNNGKDTYTVVGAANASIVGGTGINTYNVSTGGSLSGTLNGGSGTSNLLSYAKYTTSGVVVDLPLSSATAIFGGNPGGISGIRNVTGSQNGGDILVGDANPNILKANKGHNILIGGSGGGDTLTSGGADILIAGTTTYDSNISALQTILATWKTSTSANYNTVITTIEGSSFADPLDGLTGPAAQSVFDSGATDVADTLVGKGTSMTDWFFAHTATDSKPKDTLSGIGAGDTTTGI
jgi:ELWxxDGT repeat protein